MPRRVRLNDEVRPDGRVSQQDLGQVRSTLSRLGLFDPARDPSGSESVMSDGLRRALKTFQGARGLREDATLRPRGPTEESLNLLLEQDLSLRPDDALVARERTPGALAGRVGPGLENHPDDVAAVGAALRQLGHIPPRAEFPLFTGSVFDGLKSFQRQTGLARDAVVNPGGPTEQLLVQNLAARGDGIPVEPAGNRRTEPSVSSADTAGRPLHPILRARQRSEEARRRRLEAAAAEPRLGEEQRDAQRRDAGRLLDRIVQIERGEMVDRSSDEAGTAFQLREFFEASPQEQTAMRNRLRRLAEPAPEDSGGQTGSNGRNADGPQFTGDQQSALRLLRGFDQIEQDPKATPNPADVGTGFILKRFTEASPEERTKMQEFHRQRTGLNGGEIEEALRPRDATEGPQTFARIEQPPQAKPELLEFYRAGVNGDADAMRRLNLELAAVLVPARNKDNASDVGFVLSGGEEPNVAAFIKSLAELDGDGELGQELGFHAQQINVGLNITAETPAEAIGAPDLTHGAPGGPVPGRTGFRF